MPSSAGPRGSLNKWSSTPTSGNLRLTQDNSALGNKPFPEKKARPASRPATSILWSSWKALAGYADWNEGALKTGQDEIRQWALTRWKVDRPPDVVITDERG